MSNPSQRHDRLAWLVGKFGGRGPLMLLGAAAAVILILVLAKLLAKAPPAPQSEAPPVNVKVRTIVPISQLPDTFEMPGVVQPRRVVRVSAEVASRVEAIEGTEGKPCKKGQTLVRLNTDLLQAGYDRAKATAEFDARELERMIDLNERGVATSNELDQMRSKAAASRAAMEEAKAELDRAVIVAPIDGVIDRMPIEVGEYVQKGTLAAQIVDIEEMEVVVDVPERDLPYLKLGQEEPITTDSSDQPRVGQITYIGKIADRATRTTPVEITVDNGDGRLYSGQIVVVRLLRRVLTDVVMIPLAAVIPLEDGKEVYVVQDGKAVSRIVTLGIMKGADVQITGGLSAGDVLIVDGHRYVGPGQTVRIIERPASEQSE